MVRDNIIYACDFETTVEQNTETQTKTEVWSACYCELFTENVNIVGNIFDFIEYFKKKKENITLYFHNLKFDGMFILSFLIKNGYKQAFVKINNETGDGYFLENKHMKNNTFKYSISDKGQFYTITIKVKDKFIEIRDSLKLIPFALSTAGEAFNTKHRKLEMEYKGNRHANCLITESEKRYIENDVLVLKECLEFMFNSGHDSLTIGTCCKKEYKELLKTDETTTFLATENYKTIFPKQVEFKIDKALFGCENADEYVRKSYRGGWCYLVKGKENKLFKDGVTADVNSLYPSMMSSESGNKFPVGNPIIATQKQLEKSWVKNKIGTEEYYYFINFTCRFKIKDGYLPFVQIKDNILYKGTECLETSDVYNPKTKKYCEYYKDFDGNIKKATVTLTMTETDFILFNEHYNITDLEIHSYAIYKAEKKIFDKYINKYAEIKKKSKGAIRTLAKLFLNNLYGKLATSTDSSFKVCYMKDDGGLGFYSVTDNKKQTWYIPAGSAITSYSRNFTIRAAQKNYYGKNKAGFIYADTDSIHCDLQPEKIRGIKIHNSNFCCWKLESKWSCGIFVRQKTYIEKVIEENLTPENNFTGEKIENEKGYYYNVKCAGMPEKTKELFIRSIENELTEKDIENYKPFLYYYNKKTQSYTKKMYNTIRDFKIGLELPCKLRPKQINGGILLVETTYKMR